MKLPFFNKNKLGFTLIELLVVISIIGMLASVVIASLNDVRKQARDSIRLNDMRQIRVALEAFRTKNGRYPDFTHDNVSANGEFIGTGDDIDTALAPFINPVPADPVHDGVIYFYSYDSVHNVDLDCALPSAQTGLVFGFNKAETITPTQKDTCLGSHKNLDNADYNVAIIR